MTNATDFADSSKKVLEKATDSGKKILDMAADGGKKAFEKAADSSKVMLEKAADGSKVLLEKATDGGKAMLEKATDGGKAMLEKAGDKLPNLSKKQKVAAGIGLAAAAVAGIAAVRAARSRKSAGEAIVYHLEPDGETWKLTVEGSSTAKAYFQTKDEGLSAARELAHENTPSELVIHLANGSEQTRHAYES